MQPSHQSKPGKAARKSWDLGTFKYTDRGREEKTCLAAIFQGLCCSSRQILLRLIWLQRLLTNTLSSPLDTRTRPLTNCPPDQTGDDGLLATAFFIAYAISEFTQGYLIQKFPVSRLLGGNVIRWGVILCCTAAAQNYAGLTAARVVLGCLEAVISPSLIMITTQWYTRRQATVRMGIWYSGLGFGQIVGGLISFAAQSVTSKTGIAGWRIMFIAVGAFNMIVGCLVFFWMTSSIPTAKFLSEQEKYALQKALQEDQGGNGRKTFRKEGLLEASKDLQVWLLFLNTILTVIPSGFITTFSSTVIANAGFTSKQAALFNMPSGVISIFSFLLASSAILYNFLRWLSMSLLMLPTLIGAGLMSFYSQSRAGCLAGIYLINFDTAPLALIYTLAGANIQGYTKKVSTNAVIQVGFSCKHYRPTDFPGSRCSKLHSGEDHSAGCLQRFSHR